MVGAYLERVVAAAAAIDDARVLAAITVRAAEASGIVVDFEVAGRVVAPAPEVLAVEAEDGLLDTHGPWLIGFVREALLSSATRREGGVHHTDPALAGTIAQLALDLVDCPLSELSVVDPAVGGGVFLLAAAQHLQGPPAEVVDRLFGCDVDPLAIATTRAALTVWSAGSVPPDENLVVADYLDPAVTFPPADLVLGNPPFLSQLKSSTTRAAAERRNLADRWPGVGRYVDTAATFMLAAVDGLAPNGVWALIQPDSVLAAVDAEPVRARLTEAAPVARIWVDDARRFDAAVDTVALIGRQGDGPGDESVGVYLGVPADELGAVAAPSAGSWAPLLAPARGVPIVGGLDLAGRLGDLATITAGFRDQFYGLRDAVSEDVNAELRLITSGLIDPLLNRWGTTSCRYDKRAWSHPGVALDRVDQEIRGWVEARLRPKVLVASQTPTIEAVVDPDGVLVPCTPVVTIEPHDPADVWRIAALLTCPVTTALLAHAASGTALSADALRVSASRLADLPLPANEPAWDDAAMVATTGDVIATGAMMQRAYGIDDSTLTAWWRARLPRRR